MIEDSERERFEEWVKSHDMPNYFLRKDDDSDYANPYTAAEWEAWQESARQARAQATPPGWKLVPIHPTNEMIIAFMDGSPNVTEAYKEMIAAAPQKAQEG